MMAGKHIGKVLVQVRPEEDRKSVIPAPRLMQVHPRYFCNPSYSYIIAGTEFLCFILKSREMETVWVYNVREGGWSSVVGVVTGLLAGYSGV
jgi:hypothetical protein